MEQRYKIKYLIAVTFCFLLGFALINWYATINREDVVKVSENNYLTYDEAKAVASNHDPSRRYYYSVEYTKLTRKSFIPFVYNEEAITGIDKQLMSKPHD